MEFPTIALCMIIKNEKKNLPRLFESIEGCFDEIHITDTGSTDGSVEWLKEHGEDIAKCKVHVHHFTWVNSFCKARNYSFSHAKTDYIYWQDGDDCLSSKDAFIQWKKYAMEHAECFFATYHYALDKEKKPIISFVRERVFKRSINPEWQYDLHEGIILKPEWTRDYATSWSVLHMRDEQDVIADKSRNIKILEDIKQKENGLPTRLKFYYGKELYENGNPQKAIWAFEDAIKCDDLEYHDRLLAYQYASYSAFQSAQHLKEENKFEINNLLKMALDFALEGLKLDSSRAEFHCACGDINIFKGQLHKAVSFYAAAKACINPKEMSGAYEGAVYSFIDCYGLTPSLQLAKCYFHMGQIEKAKKEAQECVAKYNHKDAIDILAEIERIESLVKLDNNQEQTEDIVITCPPQSAYPFDEEIYKTKGLGGSETALVQMAKLLKQLTGRPVKVFNMREEDLIAESGVEYISNKRLNEYLSQKLPFIHIAWRHNIKLTNARTYLWCHDLVTGTVESVQNFDKIICLSDFHKNYVMAKQNVSPDKIYLSRNGIDPKKFNFERKQKDPNKLVFMSSPDRGLDRAMLICDELIKTHPDIKLHVYYGLENLYKYGLKDLAEKLKQMMSERNYVVYHGFTEQSKMYYDISDAVCLIHACTFIETFMITAIEMLALQIYTVIRSLGAISNTLADAASKGHCTLIDGLDINEYVDAVKHVLDNKLWEKVECNYDQYSWEGVAKEWIKEMSL